MRPVRTAPVPPAPPPARAAAPAPRPTWFDYLLLPVAFGLSALLADLSGLQAVPTAQTPARVPAPLLHVLVPWLFVPLGAILFWPLFYASQYAAGRRQALSAGEWLLGLAWLAALLLTGCLVWQSWGTLPGFLAEPFRDYLALGHMLAAFSLAALAAVLWLVDLVGRWPQPWTHRFGLALLLWQAAPWGLVLLWHVTIEFAGQLPPGPQP